MAAVSPVSHYLSSIGLQVWTVRNELERDIPGTLRAIKEAGYTQIELMRTLNARDFVPYARDLGLDITSAFIDWESIARPDADSEASLTAHLSLARSLGLRHLVFGYIGKGMRETSAQLQAHADRANAFGQLCQEAGIQLSYHHHAFEFAPLEGGNITGWDILLRELDPKLVQLELDVFWLALAGLDPIKTLADLRGRVSQVHLKDLKAGTATVWDEHVVSPDAFQELGRGCLDFPRILSVCAETGVQQCHVEQDQSPSPLISIANSLNFLRTL